MNKNTRLKYRNQLFSEKQTLTLGLDPFTLYAHCIKLLAPWIERMKL